jgi:hemerythrin
LQLLERQHIRLARQVEDLLHDHAVAAGAPGSTAAERQRNASWQLLHALRLHLRLEERWLSHHGVLSPQHRRAHRDAVLLAMVALHRSGSDPASRLEVLGTLQSWLETHGRSADAAAYALIQPIPPPGIPPHR